MRFEPIDTLDVSNNTTLRELYCYHNQLTTLNVRNNTALDDLYCDLQTAKDITITKDSDEKYSINFNDYISDISKVSNIIDSQTENALSFDNGIITFSERTPTIQYTYDTGKASYSMTVQIIVITQQPLIAIMPLSNAISGQFYSDNIFVTGTPPVSVDIINGKLAEGLTISSLPRYDAPQSGVYIPMASISGNPQ